MKKFFTFLIPSCLLIVAISQANAQSTLSFSLKSDSIGYGVQGSTITIFGILYNLTNSNINYKVTRVTNDWPAAWGTPENMICFGANCYAPTTNSVTESLAAKDSTLFDTEWITGDSNDTAHVRIEFFNTNDSSIRIYQNFYAIVNGSAGISNVQVNDNPISIFPNPFTTATKLSVPVFLLQNNSSLSFILCDETGRIVKAIPISVSGTLSLERDNMPSGIYFYSIFNSQQGNGNMIQRGKLIIL
jgi:hypothetical protein